MAIIDAHQHFWDLDVPWCTWPTPAEGKFHRTYTPGDLKPLIEATGVTSTLLVQAAEDVDETRAMLETARQTDFVAGVVGWVDFEDPVEAVQDLKSLCASGYLVGLRPMLQSMADTDWILQPRFAPIFAAMIEAGLVFDALIEVRHLPAITELAKLYPDLKIIIDHGAKPKIAARTRAPWFDYMSAAAKQPNVNCKLSGLLTEARPGDDADALRPYVAAILALFGETRVLWGSDWPVLELNGNYEDWLDMADFLVALHSRDSKRLIFGANAERIYGLGRPRGGAEQMSEHKEDV